MRKIVCLLMLLNLLFLAACSDKTRRDGDWDDIIHLSTKAVVLNATADSVKITTGGSWWWLCGVSIDGKLAHIPPTVDVWGDKYLLTCDFVQIERLDKKTMFVRVAPNPIGIDRKIIVSLQAGDYFDGFVVTQKGK